MLSRSHSHSLLIAHPSHQYTRNKNGMKKKRNSFVPYTLRHSGPTIFSRSAETRRYFLWFGRPKIPRLKLEKSSVFCVTNSIHANTARRSLLLVYCSASTFITRMERSTIRNAIREWSRTKNTRTRQCRASVSCIGKHNCWQNQSEWKRSENASPGHQHSNAHQIRRGDINPIPILFTYEWRVVHRCTPNQFFHLSIEKEQKEMSSSERTTRIRSWSNWSNFPNIATPQFQSKQVVLSLAKKNDGYFPRTANPDVDRVLEISINRKVCIWRPYGYMVQWLVAQRLKKLS